VALPSIDVQTVGAGAGSIAAVRDGYLTVGPESSGADPGPACYGRGGTRSTVADADLVLGYLNSNYFLGGRMRLNPELARKAIATYVAEPLGMTVEDAAEGIKKIVDSRMADLIREVTIKRGVDPSDFTIFSFGGAGPSHAFSYAAELGISQVVVPLTASVHSAFGIASADMMAVEEISHPMQSPPGSTRYSEALSCELINRIFSDLEKKTTERLQATGLRAEDCAVERFIEMRFRFQIHELTVQVSEFPLTPQLVDETVEQFIEVYESRFGKGSAFKAAGVEMVTFRVVMHGGLHEFRLKEEASDAEGMGSPVATRPVYRNGSWHEASVYRGEQLHRGSHIEGLAIIEMPDTTIVVGENQSADVDRLGNVILKLDV
jgi:N-methylhydantoinase A